MELITEYEFECTCGFQFKAPMLADDPNGEYAHNIVMLHVAECGED